MRASRQSGSTSSKNTLKPGMNMWSVFMLGFGTVIGVGWITVMGSWLSDGGALGSIIAFVLGGAIMLAIGLCYAELATIHPVVGGEVVYTYDMFGAGAAYATGWLLVFSYVAVVAFEAISVGWVLEALWPSLKGPVLYEVFGYEMSLGALLSGLVVMAVIMTVHIWGVRSTVSFQNMVVIFLLVVTVFFVGCGLLWGDVDNLEPLFPKEKSWSTGVMAVLVTTPFWYMGFNVIPQSLGELEDETKARLVPRVIIFTIVLSMLFYGLVILTAALAAPRDHLLSYDLPIVGVFEAVFESPLIAKFILLAGLAGLISTWNAMLYAAVRVLYTLGRARLIPASLSTLSLRTRAPVVAILFCVVTATLIMLLGRNAIIPIVTTSSITLTAVLFMVVMGLPRLSALHAHNTRSYRMPFGRIVQPLAAIAAFLLLAISVYTPYQIATMALPLEWTILLAWCGLGALFWMVSASLRATLSNDERRAILLHNQRGDDA